MSATKHGVRGQVTTMTEYQCLKQLEHLREWLLRDVPDQSVRLRKQNDRQAFALSMLLSKVYGEGTTAQALKDSE